jgi:hypothetical protein
LTAALFVFGKDLEISLELLTLDSSGAILTRINFDLVEVMFGGQGVDRRLVEKYLKTALRR